MPAWLRCGNSSFGSLVAVVVGIATALSVALSH
jgi:hypothetical protein